MSPLEGSFGRTPKVDLLPDKLEGFIRTQSYEPGNSESNRSGRIVDGCNASSADCKRIIEHNEEDPFKRPILHGVEQSPASTMTMGTFALVTGVPPVPIRLSLSQCEKDFQHIDFQHITASLGQLNQMYNPKNLTVFHALGGIQGIAKGLKTDLRFGLSDGCVNIQSPVSLHEAVGKVKRSRGQGYIDLDDFECRRRVLGENRLSPPKETPMLKLMRMAPSDKVLIPVTVVAAMSFGIALYLLKPFAADTGGTPTFAWGKYVAIMAAVLIIMAIGALNDRKKECQFLEWSSQRNDREAKVIRSGKHTLIPVYDILVGDVLILETGDRVPVDGIFIDGYNVECDESSATGESGGVKKTLGKILSNDGEGTGMAYLDPFIISESRVTQGSGTVLVTAVGEQSNIGQILMSMRDDECPGMGALAWSMFMASQLGNSLCVTLNLGTNLLPEILRRMNCCNFGLLFVPVLNLVRFCTNTFQSEAIFNTDAVKPSFFRLHTKIDRYMSFSLDQSLATTHQEGAITEPHRLSTMADSLRYGSAFTATEWTGIISQPIGSSTVRRHRRFFVNNPRLAVGIFLAGYGIPLAVAAFRVARGLRIASGLTSTVSGVTVIPLRTAEGFPVWSWILTYGVWVTAFSVYLWRQTRRIPRNANHRRQLYLFCVIMAAGHFTTAMSQASGAPPLPDIFTLYGPIVLTFCAYSFFLVYEAVLHEVPKGGESLDREASPTPDGDSAATVPFSAQPDQTALGIGVAAMVGVPSEVALS